MQTCMPILTKCLFMFSLHPWKGLTSLRSVWSSSTLFTFLSCVDHVYGRSAVAPPPPRCGTGEVFVITGALEESFRVDSLRSAPLSLGPGARPGGQALAV